MRVIKVLVLTGLIFGFFQGNLFSIIYSKIEGVIKDKQTGVPIENVDIRLYRTNFMHEKYPFYQTKTDKNGTFKIDKIKAELYYMQCEKKGYISNLPEYILVYYSITNKLENPNMFHIKEGEIKHFTIMLEKGGSVSGIINEKDAAGTRFFNQVSLTLKRKVKPEELPNLGIKPDEDNFINVAYGVVLYSTDGRFSNNGKYFMDGLEAGQYQLVLERYKYCDVKINFEIIKGQNIVRDYTYDLTNTTGIKGKITINNEAPRYASVDITDMNGKSIVFFQCSRNSEDYSISLIEEGKYRVEATILNNARREFKAEKTIDIAKNQIKNVDFNFVD